MKPIWKSLARSTLFVLLAVSASACNSLQEAHDECYWDAFKRTCTANAGTDLARGYSTGQTIASEQLNAGTWVPCNTVNLFLAARLRDDVMVRDVRDSAYYISNECYDYGYSCEDTACAEGDYKGTGDGYRASFDGLASIAYNTALCYPGYLFGDFDWSSYVEETCNPPH